MKSYSKIIVRKSPLNPEKWRETDHADKREFRII